MGHEIEDCSTYTALIILIAWYLYAILGSILVIEDNARNDRHCYVSENSIIPSETEPSHSLGSV